MIKVQFTHIDRLVDEVRGAHRRRGIRLGTVDESLIADVRRQLMACESDNLMALALSFQAVELAACVSIAALKTNNTLMERACTVIRHRPFRDVLWYGVTKLIESYPNPRLESMIRELVSGGIFRMDGIPENMPPRINDWFQATSLVCGILNEYEQHDDQGLKAFMEDVNIVTSSGMRHAVWDALLSEGDKALLLRQKSRQILLKMEDAVQTEALGRWSRNYLITLEDLPVWDEAVLRLIKSRFGIPKFEKNKVEGPFWRPLPAVIKERFYHWCIGLEIEAFFDGDRAQFWKKFYKSHHIVDVKSILSGDGFMLRFENFGVVEFKNTGNAAYVYPSNYFEVMWGNSSSKNVAKEFKNKGKTLRHPYLREGRILHSGDWQMTYGHAVRSLIQRNPR